MTGVILLNFGEPETTELDEVVPFLERIFLTNASLEGELPKETVRTRSHELAVRRAPGLIEEYRAIGGSPLNRQAAAQAEALRAELGRRGYPVHTCCGMQFTEPSIAAAAQRAFDAGVDRLVALPVYPLCGASTTVASLAALQNVIADMDRDIDLVEISGWHRHPLYLEMRTDGVRRTADAAGLTLNDARIRLVFSAHGTPVRFLAEGSRYDVYVREHCAAIAATLGVQSYSLGYQNHGNRPIAWTQPDIDDVIPDIDADAIVVVPVSFMHEQSETLAELDHDLREKAMKHGLAFHRVPVPHDDARFARVLADLVLARLGRSAATSLHPCTCRPSARTRCTNGAPR
jgi:ferrochelatase